MVDLTVIRPKDDGPPRLIPATQFDIERFGRIRAGKPALARITFPRSLQHLRWYRGLVGVVADAVGMHPNALHAHLKFKAELVRSIILVDGKPVVELKSTAFSEMDEGEFNDFRITAVNVLFRDFLDGVRRADVWKRVEEICGPCPW